MTNKEYCKEDEAIEAILVASGSSLRHYMPHTKDKMRKAMRDALRSAYEQGSSDTHDFYKLAEDRSGCDSAISHGHMVVRFTDGAER